MRKKLPKKRTKITKTRKPKRKPKWSTRPKTPFKKMKILLATPKNLLLLRLPPPTSSNKKIRNRGIVAPKLLNYKKTATRKTRTLWLKLLLRQLLKRKKLLPKVEKLGNKNPNVNANNANASLKLLKKEQNRQVLKKPKKRQLLVLMVLQRTPDLRLLAITTETIENLETTTKTNVRTTKTLRTKMRIKTSVKPTKKGKTSVKITRTTRTKKTITKTKSVNLLTDRTSRLSICLIKLNVSIKANTKNTWMPLGGNIVCK